MGILGDPSLDEILFPEQLENWDYVTKDPETQFAYYTDMETFFKILQNKNIWMRNTLLLNDTSEITYAYEQLARVINEPVIRDKFKNILLSYGLNNSDADFFIQKFPSIYIDGYEEIKQKGAFVACFTEHTEGDTGRLSMWRAYGNGKVKIALVFKFKNALPHQSFLKVEYVTSKWLAHYLSQILDRITANQSMLKYYANALQYGALFGSLAYVLSYRCQFFKNPAFMEEKEWRFVYVGKEKGISFPHVSEIINGVPQIIIKYPLAKNNLTMSDTSLCNTLDHVLIGPCENPELIRDAVLLRAQKSKLNLRKDQVRISNVPLRG